MKTKIFNHVAIVLLLTVFFSSCSNQVSDDTEIFTYAFYVCNPNLEKDEFNKSECGYLLFLDTGRPHHYHNGFVWAENLPKEYQIDLLPVIVTFRYIKDPDPEGGCWFPVIKIIKINKNIKQ